MKKYGCSMLLAALLVAAPGEAAAQQTEHCSGDIPEEILLTNVELPGPVCKPSPFQIRALGDFAGSGMRSAARDVEMFTTNTGLSDTGRELQGRLLPFYQYGTVRSPTDWISQYLEIQWFAAASRSDWLRNREKQPSLKNALGGGWTTILNLQRFGGGAYQQWSGHDGSVGVLHSGAQAAPEGCLDHGPHSRHYPYGFPLLAGSDCPDTWGTAGWAGRGLITLEGWRAYFDAVGPDRFSFDFWRVPREFYSEKPTVGDFQVFGMMSDHGFEYLRDYYGNVIPTLTNPPTKEGYPIGLDISFNAYSFKTPDVSRGFIFEALITNATKEVYGIELDYDSLYFGFNYRNNRINQRNQSFALPQYGAILNNELGRIAGCMGARPVPGSISCPNNFSDRGFRGGAAGFIVLKSPIGDLRNKHFSDPNSPFYSPGHPLAGDTITFNRLGNCNFDCTGQWLINNVRRGWGAIAASVPDMLDGRDPRQVSRLEHWRMFQNVYAPDGTDRYCDPTNPRGPGCFNYMVPGAVNDSNPTWTYTRRPPGAPIGPDTLWFYNCRPPTDVGHPHANRCIGLWADTLPDKVLHWTRNNVWVGAGPFPLKSTDTVAFVVAAFSSPDSATLMRTMHAFYNLYVKDFYLAPGQPPPPSIIDVTITPRSFPGTVGETVILSLDDAAESYRDPYALKYVQQLRNPEPGSIHEAIMMADPTAADRLEAMVNSNIVDTVYIFKSCDNTRTVTASTSLSCPSSPARSETREPIGTGWQAYSWLVPNSAGVFPKTWSDANVAPGRKYFYSLLAASKGITLDTRYVATLPDGTTEVRDTSIVVVPPSRTNFGFRTNNPWVVEVYVPASRQAGAEPARAELRSRTGIIPFSPEQVRVTFDDDAEIGGIYRLLFGEDALIRQYSAVGSTTVDSTVLTLYQRVRARMPDGSYQMLPWRELTFRSTEPRGVPLQFATSDLTGYVPYTQTRSVEGNTEIVETRTNHLTGVLLDGNDVPLLASSNLRFATMTPPDFRAHPNYRGFTIGVDNFPPSVSSPTANAWMVDSITLRSEAVPSFRFCASTCPVNSVATGAQWGTYLIDFGAMVFGEKSNLPEVDVRNPLATQEHYQRLLRERPVISRTEVNDEVLNAIRRDMSLPTLTLDDLIEVNLPFTVRNLAFGEEGVGTPVRIAMLRSSKIDKVVLGNVPDTVTVEVPPDVWIPGEGLIFLEQVQAAETDETGQLRLVDGQPVMSSDLRVTFSRAMIACETGLGVRATCNPVKGPPTAARPGHVEVRPNGHPDFPNGWDLRVVYKNPFNSLVSYEFEVIPAKIGANITKLTRASLDAVHTVPNPYIVRNGFEFEADVRRLMFVNLPPRGTIHIFTVSGQFVQRLEWEPEDLHGHGDLFWDMQTREGTEIAAGLYVYVVQTRDPETGRTLKKTGKFIVIR